MSFFNKMRSIYTIRNVICKADKKVRQISRLRTGRENSDEKKEQLKGAGYI